MTFSREDRSIGRAARIALAILAITFATGQEISFGQERGLSGASTASGNGAFEATTQAPYVVQGPRTLFTVDGTPVHIWSRVQLPYNASAYETFRGQPMNSGESILSPSALGPGG